MTPQLAARAPQVARQGAKARGTVWFQPRLRIPSFGHTGPHSSLCGPGGSCDPATTPALRNEGRPSLRRQPMTLGRRIKAICHRSCHRQVP